ncbi:cysteine desulfurase [Sporobacter termitidis DSM 10068]|uniref:Cysteine desulfurase n=1 Tax=Sporobacter termitidis DSM 10068 TaxID=1123282 RepID=A0A1M5TUB3_9FIRM|nr:cysteine desulfurase family protein [Sporobacter termitidis]SHH54289.1 cysteine desulfurase [Sporobacter termitidis DSM 10068]
MIYLDYAADTPAAREVLDVFSDTALRYAANPNSLHTPGRQAGARLAECTEQIKTLLNLKNSDVIYTSGATEANNLALKGVAEKYRNSGKHIIATYLEHSSVNGALAALQNSGFEIDYVDSGSDGLVDLEQLKALLRKDTILVSACYVDSEMGVTQKIHDIAAILSGYPGCRFHVDATQAVGKVPLSLDGADLFTFSPHKFYGLNGSGILIKKEELLLEPQIHGGLSATPYRSGTPALALAAACAKALELALAELAPRCEHVSGLNKKLRAALTKYPKVKINSTAYSVPHILSVSMPGVKTEDFRDELDAYGVCVSTRSACCAPNSVSRPVYAVTKDRKRAVSTLRVSLSHLTTEQDVDEFLACFEKCYDKFAG